MITTKTNMTLSHFHDFYYLLALQTAARHLPQFQHSVTKLVEDIDFTLEDVADNMALRTFTYLFAACLGEARHTRSGNARARYIPQTCDRSRHEIFSNATVFAPDEHNIKVLIDAFGQDWRSGFGGKPWQEIAKALLDFGKTPNVAWLDHVVDLEHNNGTAFNKDDAKSTIHFDTNYDNFSAFLTYKFENDILKQPKYTSLGDEEELRVSPKVYRLLERYCNISGMKFPVWIWENLKNLAPYNVIWGSAKLDLETKWYEWVDVSYGNTPKMNVVIALSRLEDVLPKSKTRKELKAHYKKAIKNAKKVCGKFLTKEYSKRITRKFSYWYKLNKSAAKLPKCKKTYQVLPVDVTYVDDGLLLLIHVPYESIGKKTENGEIEHHVPWVKVNSYNADSTLGAGFISCEYGGVMLHSAQAITQITDKKLEALLD